MSSLIELWKNGFRRGAKAVPRVLLPAQEPVSVRDIMEAVEVCLKVVLTHLLLALTG